jgi:hypothetical protein
MSSNETETDLLAAIEFVTDADEAERLMQEATRQVRESKNDTNGWRAAELRAERKWGELLGPAEQGPPKGSRNAAKNNVSGEHVISQAERNDRKWARKVAAVPLEVFEAYMTEMKGKAPSRAGLLRIVRQASAEQAINALKEAGNGKTPSIRSVARELKLDDDRTLRKDWDALHKLGRVPAKPVTKEETAAAQPKAAPPPKNWNDISNAARQREVKRRMKERGEYNGIFDLMAVSLAISKACAAMEGIEPEDYNFSDEDHLWRIEAMIDDLITMGTWQKRQLSALQSRISDRKVLEKIGKLRNMARITTFPEEARSFEQTADQLERNRELKLASGS